MGFGEAIGSCFSKYVTFSGRACRSEYWFFALFVVIVDVVANVVDAAAGTSLLGVIIGLALFLPNLAVSVRRLHDIDRSGWWVLLGLIPVVGWVIVIVWACTRGTPGPNRFGPDSLPGFAGAIA